MFFIAAGSRSRFTALVSAAFSLAALVAVAAPVAAQPFDGWFSSLGFPTNHGFVEIPHSASLNPTGAFTFEAWVLDQVPDGDDLNCRSIAGKNFRDAWWIGSCNVNGHRTLRSYLRGEFSRLNGGRIVVGQWNHVAVTWNGTTRRHYVNGELTAQDAVASPLTTSNDPMRIGSDVEHELSPKGSIDEVRLWNVARTEAQLRANLNLRITADEPGLVGVWPLGNGNNIVGPEDGVLTGNGVGFLIGAVAANCGDQTATSFCISDRFQVTARYRTGVQSSNEGTAQTIPCFGPVCEHSGVFWFFQNTNWELMFKVLNGCELTDHWWVFNAGITNQFFRLEVTDVTKAESKIYFNYPGPPAPAITDIFAFDVCPP